MKLAVEIGYWDLWELVIRSDAYREEYADEQMSGEAAANRAAQRIAPKLEAAIKSEFINFLPVRTILKYTADDKYLKFYMAPIHPEEEIDKVTTPRGCTIAGLNEMEHFGLSSAVIKGIITSYNEIEKLK